MCIGTYGRAYMVLLALGVSLYFYLRIFGFCFVYLKGLRAVRATSDNIRCHRILSVHYFRLLPRSIEALYYSSPNYIATQTLQPLWRDGLQRRVLGQS